jgi:hypothetical protein
MNQGRKKLLFFVLAGGAMLTAHTESGGAAINAFIRAVSVDVLSGRSLKAPIAVRR